MTMNLSDLEWSRKFVRSLIFVIVALLLIEVLLVEEDVIVVGGIVVVRMGVVVWMVRDLGWYIYFLMSSSHWFTEVALPGSASCNILSNLPFLRIY